MAKFAAMLRSSPAVDAARTARRIFEAGFHGLGLEHPLHAFQWEAVRDVLPRESVFSVQLFLPYHRSIRPFEPSPFLIGALHPEERRDALRQGLETITFADRHAIPHVLVPPTLLEGDLRRTWSAAARKTPVPKALLDSLEGRRRDDAAPRLDSLRSLLSKLLDAADQYQVRMAITPGGFIDELPSFEEAAEIFREFRGAPLAAWPDTLRVAAARELAAASGRPLDPCVEATAGVTVTDHSDAMEPAPPGAGRLDRNGVRPLLERAGVWLAGVPGPSAAEPGEALEESRAFLEELARPPGAEAEAGLLRP